MKQIRHDRKFAIFYFSSILLHICLAGFIVWYAYQGSIVWLLAIAIVGGVFCSLFLILVRQITSYECKECDHIILPPNGWWKTVFSSSFTFHCWRCNIDWRTRLGSGENRTVTSLPLGQTPSPASTQHATPPSYEEQLPPKKQQTTQPVPQK